MDIKFVLTLFSFFIIQSAFSKRQVFSVAEFGSRFPVQVVGKVMSTEKNVFNVLILKEKTNMLNGHINLDGQDPQQKPNENLENGGIYFLFLKKKNTGNYEIGRSIEVEDFLISEEEMKFRAIKTKCTPALVSCILKE